MIAKKPSPSDAGHAAETRKVDSMSELVAGMLLDDPDATAPPPDPSPASMSAVRPMAPRASSRPTARVLDTPPRTSQITRIVVVALIVAIAAVAVVAAVLFR